MWQLEQRGGGYGLWDVRPGSDDLSDRHHFFFTGFSDLTSTRGSRCQSEARRPAAGQTRIGDRGWDLSEAEARGVPSNGKASPARKRDAFGTANAPTKHPINRPRLEPCTLMTQMAPNGTPALSGSAVGAVGYRF